MKISEVSKIMTQLVKSDYMLNDKAHQLGHACHVAMNAIAIVDKLFSGDHRLKTLAVIASYAHDVRNWQDRDTHHMLGAVWIMDHQSELKQAFALTNNELFQIASACMTHRASCTIKRKYDVEHILATADRGELSSDKLPRMIDRAALYTIDKIGCTEESAIHHAHIHMKEKFGRNGYAYQNFPNCYMDMWGDGLNELWDAIDAL